MTRQYTIRFHTDWHCGCGMGRGAEVDAHVIRDRFGLPYVPGRTVKGLLRHACERLEEVGEFAEDTAVRLFGGADSSSDGPTEARSRVMDATLSGRLTTYFTKEHPDRVSVLFRSLSSTAIDGHGQAKKHTLRRIEVACPLEVVGAIEIPKDDRETVEKCMAYVKHLGSHRSRGLGRCTMQLGEAVDA